MSKNNDIMTPTEYFNKRCDKTIDEMTKEQLFVHPKWCIELMKDYGAHIRGKLRGKNETNS